ncbi:MAG: cation transporter, partial [Reichenbachiella sp.]
MQKSTFIITKMDCPSEEQMIRMKLDGFPSIKQLNFDIANRKLIVFHTGEASVFEQSIYDLKFDAT